MKKITVGILGATSYTGLELIRLLRHHPNVTIAYLSSQSNAGARYSEVFPEVKGLADDVLISPEDAPARDVDCIFACLPHAVAAAMLLPAIKKGVRVVDLSADFRIKDAAVYQKWYKTVHPCPEYLSSAVYGLCEHYRSAVKNAQVVANPGCYPTSILLPLLPLLGDPSAQVGDVIIADSKSGVSGAGRSLKMTSHFVEVYEDFSPYAIGRSHRHLCEIDQELVKAAGRSLKVNFSPHLLPVNRGILSTVYFFTPLSAQECLDKVKAAYAGETFVRVRESSDLPHVKYVAHTNYCDISFAGGGDGNPVIAVSAIDNLIKGASGQAVQNMNIMFGFEESESLIA
jgi:N-acetyl-gamma-glutamyl-phosphate reductase